MLFCSIIMGKSLSYNPPKFTASTVITDECQNGDVFPLTRRIKVVYLWSHPGLRRICLASKVYVIPSRSSLISSLTHPRGASQGVITFSLFVFRIRFIYRIQTSLDSQVFTKAPSAWGALVIGRCPALLSSRAYVCRFSRCLISLINHY